MNTCITVIIPSALRSAPSGELWLDRALRSVNAQTHRHGEILVGLDPGTKTLWPSYWPNLRLVHAAQCGHQAASNAAVAKSEGDLIAFLEDDDAWRPEHLKTMFTMMLETGADFISCSQEAVTPDGLILGPFHFPTASSWFLTRQVWNKVGGFDTSFRIHHDNHFLSRLNGVGARRLHVVPETCDLAHPWIYRLSGFTPILRRLGLACYTVERTIQPESIMAECQKDQAKNQLSEQEYERLKQLHGMIGW